MEYVTVTKEKYAVLLAVVEAAQDIAPAIVEFTSDVGGISGRLAARLTDLRAALARLEEDA
jgi:hypothetical protein